MSEKQEILTQMVQKFKEKHGRAPGRIIVAPVALVVLGLKRSIAPSWNGTLVECRLFSASEVTSKHEKTKAVNLGVFVKEKRGKLLLAACDLKA